jgi:hypothetical protein
MNRPPNTMTILAFRGSRWDFKNDDGSSNLGGKISCIDPWGEKENTDNAKGIAPVQMRMNYELYKQLPELPAMLDVSFTLRPARTQSGSETTVMHATSVKLSEFTLTTDWAASAPPTQKKG